MNKNQTKLMADCSANTITLEQGIEWTETWRNTFPEPEALRAFKIPLEDFNCLVNVAKTSGLNVVAIRAYLGIETKPGLLSEYKLVLLPIVENQLGEQRDVWELDGSSLIYDITTPCPAICDLQSPLMTGQTP